MIARQPTRLDFRYQTLFLFSVAISISSGCENRSPNFSYERPSEQKNLLWQDEVDGENSDHLTELWYAHFIKDSKIGHRRFLIEKRTDNSDDLLRIVSEDHLETYRFARRNEQNLTQVSVEHENGSIHSFGYRLETGDNVSQVDGTIDGNMVRVTRKEGNDAPESTAINWPQDGPSIFAIEQSLRSQPMTAGETRTVRVFRPLNDTMATVRLAATANETIEVGGESRELLRVEINNQGNKDDLASFSTSWIDTDGTIIKTEYPFMSRSMVLCSKEEANASNRPYNVDIGFRNVVPVEVDFDENRQASKAIYRVSLETVSPKLVFENSLGQSVRMIGEKTAQISVKEILPTMPATVRTADQRPTADEKAPNALIDSDNPSVRVFADAIVDRNQDPWKTAKLIENSLFMRIDKNETSQVFDSASVVATKLSGDCSEHAVLLAAACRSHGIPARIVVGLVYAKDRRGFLFHMWNDVWINDRWVPLDATVGKGRVGVDHIRFRHSSLAGQTPYQVVTPIVNVIGQLKIQVEGLKY